MSYKKDVLVHIARADKTDVCPSCLRGPQHVFGSSYIPVDELRICKSCLSYIYFASDEAHGLTIEHPVEVNILDVFK